MKNKLKYAILILLSVIGLSIFTIPRNVSALDNVCQMENVSKSVREAAGCEGDEDKLPGAVVTIINVIIGVAGLVAVIFIIIGGINYMTSSGESTKVEKARKTILYAVIGLVIVALAFTITNFVIANINGDQSSSEEANDDSNNSNNNSNNNNNNKSNTKSNTKNNNTSDNNNKNNTKSNNTSDNKSNSNNNKTDKNNNNTRTL